MSAIIKKLFKSFKKGYLIYQMQADYHADGNASLPMRDNVEDAMTSREDFGGESKPFWNDRPLEAMSDCDWWKLATEDTDLAKIENPTANQMSFVRKMTYESNGDENDIINQSNIIALVINSVTDDEGLLNLNEIPLGVEKAWKHFHPTEELHLKIEAWAYYITCGALVEWYEWTVKYGNPIVDGKRIEDG